MLSECNKPFLNLLSPEILMVFVGIFFPQKYLEDNKSSKVTKSQLGDMSLNSSDAHINFIQQLLTECKGKVGFYICEAHRKRFSLCDWASLTST